MGPEVVQWRCSFSWRGSARCGGGEAVGRAEGGHGAEGGGGGALGWPPGTVGGTFSWHGSARCGGGSGGPGRGRVGLVARQGQVGRAAA